MEKTGLKGYRILIADDEPDILEFLSYNIEREGYEVRTVNDGKSAIRLAAEFRPHLIILDVMMPGMDGIETCEEIRRSELHSGTMIVFLTARAEDYSQIAGFTAGADDYITKPVRPRVLLSRITALLRRVDQNERGTPHEYESIQSTGGLSIDRDRFIVTCEGREIILPRKEFELLNLLASKPEKVFTRRDIFSRVWDNTSIVGERTIDVHIRKLREKIGENYIRTVKGVGYKFVRQ